MSKDKRLGRGLAALLGETNAEPQAPPPDVIAFPGNEPGDAQPDTERAEPTIPPVVETEHASAHDPQPNAPQPLEAQQRYAAESAIPVPVSNASSPPSDSAGLERSATEFAEQTDAQNDGDALLNLSVYAIDDNPFQPRRDFSESEIASLSESLKTHDMLQPVLVRRNGDRYQLISGERRLRAAIQAGWQTVPARIREANDRLVAELAIVENLQRKDLNPVEKALSFRRYIDEHACTQDDLAQRLKIDRSSIANLMRLLELPEEILRRLREGSLSAGHARALLPLGEENLQLEFARKIRGEGWSVRATERNVQTRIQHEDGGGSTGAAKSKRTKNRHIASMEQELKTALGAKVEIRQSGKRSGQIVIHFSSHEEFERLRGYLGETTRSDSAAG